MHFEFILAFINMLIVVRIAFWLWAIGFGNKALLGNAMLVVDCQIKKDGVKLSAGRLGKNDLQLLRCSQFGIVFGNVILYVLKNLRLSNA